ncbi:ABC transporter permease [Jatrophihabitans telluris]|uniref:ABC transporter permease n=1 Tax=Jatrophihabitans telluris TaxID=2038343 RepID=A0ABY4R4K6_9ACTN|nr:ABC transporter permease subunit [Jatrophihabitans telluris]UQX89829.1 ABC transporter permease [Jatrophihabitans telluris]
MINLLRSEVLKIRSTQVWIWMMVLVVAITVAATLASVLSISADTPTDGIDYFGIWTNFGVAGVALLVLGILGLTTEFRHKTITPTLLATPNRLQLLLGKALGYVVFAIPYGVVCLLINLITAWICLRAKGLPVQFGDGAVSGMVRSLLGLVLLAFFGLGLGALVRNQAAAMVVGILYLSVLNLLFAGIPWIRRVYLYEPAGALRAFTSRDQNNYDLSTDVFHVVPWAGGLILLAWCLVFLGLGYLVSLKRDIS